MYGVVVLMALSSSAEAPDCGRNKGCHGCSGYSGCSGYVSYGCNGGCHGRRHGHRHGCNGGCAGYSGCSGYGGGCSGTIYYQGGCGGGAPVMPKAGGHSYLDTDPSRATLVVTLPSAAQLVVDDYTVASTSEQHTYVTAPLAGGETRTITLKADVVVDGKRQTLSRQVTVGAGQHTINLAEAQTVAAK